MASDYLLEIDGIKGESLDEKFKDSVEIDSWGFTTTNMGGTGRGGGGGTGKAEVSDLQFNKQADKSTPLLMKASFAGDHIKKAVLHCRKAGGKGGQVEYMTITIEDFMVSSYQTGGGGGASSIPMDSFTLNFTRIKYEYKPQKEDGGLEGAISAAYDRALNKAS
ncbi:type VI secretion system tube protein Hcp [Luteimonas sp. SJ-92]|uniref:Type VI secretion system tube protein Hcp n=1 Tax=Luteimonas salinisoli TaxID=2752307 RepID=A0A853JIA5_9GAMM|nr:type VI secretion system tube protein Hcp [Luteimonas salinisoli]